MTLRKKEIVRFGLLFFGFVAFFFTVFSLIHIHLRSVEYCINAFTAQSTAYFANVLGIQATAKNVVLTIEGFSARIIIECTGIFTMCVYLACLFAYRSGIRKKILAITIGLPIIYVVNIVRLLTQLVIDSRLPQYSEFVHVYLWEGAFIVVVAVLWLVWLDTTSQRN